jgi:OOP family OmpA-OmpF porin
VNEPINLVPKDTAKKDDFNRLRELLLGEEKRAVSQIQERLDNKRLRTEDIADVLAEAIEYAQINGKGISEPLTKPVEKAVLRSIRENPETFANILYPSILPAIRRAIQSALNQFVETTDALVAQHFSLDAVKWRLESIRTGIPFAEILIRNTMVYRVEQVLLIHNVSGLLIDSVYASDEIKRDSDAVSGMLNAIESFMHDSFNSEKDEKLNRVRLGNHIIYLAHGPRATLASVVSGAATPEYQERIRQTVEQIHSQNSDALKTFKGNTSSINGITPLLDTCLKSQYQAPSKKEGHKTIIQRSLGFGLGALFLLFVGYKIANTIEVSRVEHLVDRLNAKEGIVVYNHSKEDGQWHIHGMIDTRLKGPTINWDDFSLRENQFVFDWTRFQSMDSSDIANGHVNTVSTLFRK